MLPVVTPAIGEGGCIFGTPLRQASTVQVSGRSPQSPIGRGLLISVVAVIATAIAHCVAASYAPSLGSVVLAITVLAPLCVALGSIRHTRRQLLGVVTTGQVFLHGIFSLSAGVGNPERVHALLTNASCSALLAHVAALGVTYAAVLRADDLTELLHTLLNVSGRLLLGHPPTAVIPVRISLTSDVWFPVEERPGSGPTPLRGPPTPVR